MTPARTATDVDLIEMIGNWSCTAELLSADGSLPIERRADFHILSLKFRGLQMDVAGDYPHANVLGEGPNVSHTAKPNPWRTAFICAAITVGCLFLWALCKGWLHA